MIQVFFMIASIFFIGDAQVDSYNSYPDSIATIVAESIGVGTHIYDVGDLSEHGYTEEYVVYDTIFPNTTPVPGNHDWYTQLQWWPYGIPPVDVIDNGVHIVGWDTNTLGNLEYLTQILDDDMPTILYMHHPVYSDNIRNGRTSTRIEAIYRPIIEATEVDLVICGHGHAYERHGKNKITYLVIGGAGAPLDSVGTSDTQIVSNSIHHFVEIQVVDDWMNVFVRDLNGFVFDTFEIYVGDNPLGLPGVVGSNIVPTEYKTWIDVKTKYLD